MKAEEVGRTEGKRVNANDDDDYVLLRTIGEHVKKSVAVMAVLIEIWRCFGFFGGIFDFRVHIFCA
jgi:hypothetical protein